MSKSTINWPTPEYVIPVAGKIRIINETDIPQTLLKNDHFCQVHPTVTPITTEPDQLPGIKFCSSSNIRLNKSHENLRH